MKCFFFLTHLTSAFSRFYTHHRIDNRDSCQMFRSEIDTSRLRPDCNRKHNIRPRHRKQNSCSSHNLLPYFAPSFLFSIVKCIVKRVGFQGVAVLEQTFNLHRHTYLSRFYYLQLLTNRLYFYQSIFSFLFCLFKVSLWISYHLFIQKYHFCFFQKIHA